MLMTADKPVGVFFYLDFTVNRQNFIFLEFLGGESAPARAVVYPNIKDPGMSNNIV